jgi:hypothetical protein
MLGYDFESSKPFSAGKARVDETHIASGNPVRYEIGG